MAGLGIFLSQRLWPVPFEWGRLGRLVAAAAVVLVVGSLAPADFFVAIPVKLVALGGGFAGTLAASGFLTREERAALARLFARSGAAQ